ncbi:MAG TPA: S9 family peptidase [Vicinamibacteria bacterium]|nr:S9 family peptidase [Vicinamibacteria bacterium]
MSLARARSTIALCLALAPVAAPGAPSFTATEMMRLRRLGDLRPSPDGTRVAFALTDIDLPAGMRNSDIFVMPTAGGPPQRVVADPASDTRPRWSRDGRRLAFLSTRGGAAQVWVTEAGGGPAWRLTSLATGVDAFEWLDDERLAVVSAVFPDCGQDDGCNARRLAEAGQGSSARAYDALLFRHWDRWSDGRRSHLLAVRTDGQGAIDLTPGPGEVPPFSLEGEDWAVSPEGSEACFSRKDAREEAWSTNADLLVVPTTGGPARVVGRSAGYDGSCRYSPDGRWLGWRAQERNGYESDRWQLMVLDRRSGQQRRLTPSLDRQVEEFTFAPDGGTVTFTVQEDGHTRVLSVPTAGGPIRTVLDGASLGELSVLPGGGGILAAAASLTHPAELVRFGMDGSGPFRVSRLNDATLAPFALRAGESVHYQGAAGKTVQAWLVKPPDFDPSRRYPLLVLIHGGPQGAWTDGWTYRWNAEVFASAGFVVFMPNPRGSVGWGQEFTDDVNRDWGGRAFEDVMRGTDWAEALPFVEKGRTAAAGASFGGYMVNWIAGHTDRFRALVSHDGMFDTVSAYYSTEELWFPEWEFGGPPWRRPDLYQRWNPANHVAQFRTPTLVVHGERDFRLPLEQGLSMYAALRRQGVPARLLVFPDENHWVLKPANSVRWYEEVLAWLRRWTGGDGRGAGGPQ